MYPPRLPKLYRTSVKTDNAQFAMDFSGGLFLGIFALCVLLYWKVKEAYKYFEKRGIPYVEPVFIIGSNVKGVFLRRSMAESWQHLYSKLQGHKIGGFFQFTKPMYMARDPEYIIKILVSDFSHFHDRGVAINEEVNPLDAHLFLLNGQRWKVLRSKLCPIFSSGKLKWMFGEMSKCGDLLIKHFETLSDKNDIDIKDDVSRFTTDVIGSCAFGFELESLKNPDSKFREIGKKVTNLTFCEVVQNLIRMSFPKLFVKLKLKTNRPEVTDFFCSITKQAFEHRISTGMQRNDIIQLLLQLREKGSIDMEDSQELQDGDLSSGLKIEFTDELLTAQSFVFFIAGFEATSSTMYFTLYHLSKSPRIQEKLREEIRKSKEKHGNFTYDSLKEMKYLDYCISETLRLYPPLPHHIRECTKEYTFPDGQKIEKGSTIIIPIYALQRDPEYFSEPDSYIPERFENPIIPGTYSSFGDGPRTCIGKRFAIMEMKMAISRIIDGYILEESKENLSDKKVQLSTTSMLLSSNKPLKIQIKKINY